MAFVIPLALGAISAAGAGAAGASTLAAVGIGSTVAGSAAAAYGAYQQGQAEKGAANYNAVVSEQNAQVAKQNALIASQSGNIQAGISEQKTRAEAGGIRANIAASGVDVNTGSAAAVQQSASELGEFDALTIRSNATREAYGYQQQARSEEAQSTLDRFEAKQAGVAGTIGAASTLLGGVGSAAENFAKWQSVGGMGF